MSAVFALVDCNNFYASCEKLFHPSLEGKPVVVLSNNDGCVIARSEEAKFLGIRMGVPVFEVEEIINQHKVHVFSTNYALYGDISQRVMNILAQSVADLEIYSIDEAFLDLSSVPEDKLMEFAFALKKKVKRWTGIPVSVGIGPTKTLAKAANHLAKSDSSHQGVFSFVGHTKANDFLATIPVHEVWGVGEKYNEYFARTGIKTARDLKEADLKQVQNKYGVMGQRLVLELKGTVCYPLNQNPELKKEICTSRSFGRPLTSFDDLAQATTTYVGKVARKLRKQKALAQSILIFIMTNKYASGPQYVNYKIVKLPLPTNQSQELIHYALIALKALYRKGFKYKKSGAIVSDVIPESGFQTALWDEDRREKNKKLMETIDKINMQAGLDKVQFGIQGSGEAWKMNQQNLSPHYTTRWEDILIVDVDKK